MPEDQAHRPPPPVLSVPRNFPLDLLVRTPAEVNRRLRWGDGFLQEVMGKGKVLYEA